MVPPPTAMHGIIDVNLQFTRGGGTDDDDAGAVLPTLRITVTDQGSGIAREDIPDLLGRLFSTKKTASELAPKESSACIDIDGGSAGAGDGEGDDDVVVIGETSRPRQTNGKFGYERRRSRDA